MLHTLAASSVRDLIRSTRPVGDVLPALSPSAYARGHAAFEARSDQRRLIAEHLGDRLVRRTADPLSVLSVGCGDGSLDAVLAADACDRDPSRAVRWVGVDPYDAGVAAFGAALAGLRRDRLTVQAHTGAFPDVRLEPGFDAITFVHSMYYVADVAEAVRAAHSLLRPGGELLVLSAPRTGMNALAEVLAPPVDGHSQWFSEEVTDGFAEAGLAADVVTIDARLDLADADDDVLDFTVQARLDDELRTLVRAYLRAIADDDLVPHSVDVHRCVRAET